MASAHVSDTRRGDAGRGGGRDAGLGDAGEQGAGSRSAGSSDARSRARGRRGRLIWDWILMRDVGLVKMFAAGRVLLCVPAGMAAGYALSLAFGLPAVVGLMLGALPAFLTCFVVVDEKASRVAARSALLIVPFVIALFGSIALREFRILELVLIVGLLFVQFYSTRFGVWVGDFGGGLFAAYLCGLLLPLPLATFPALALVFAASLAATIAIRSLVFHPNAYRSLMRSRRAFLAWQNQILFASADLLDGDGSVARLQRRRVRSHEAALIADGMLAQAGSGATGETAEHLHRLLFDTEWAIDGLARIAEESSVADTPVAVRAALGRANRVVLEHGGRAGDRAARELLDWAEASPEVGNDPSLLHSVHRVTLLLGDLAASDDDWTAVRRSLPRSGDGVPFQSPVVLMGGRPAGSAPILNAEIEGGGMSGPWSRLRVSPALRTGIQAAVAVAITEPLAFLLDGQRFYWGVIGVMVVLAGTNSTHERLRKVANRGIGTVIGGAIGIVLVGVLGTTHPWWTLIVVVVALAAGMYGFTRSYVFWVIGLVVVLCQVYAASGQFTDSLILYRLAENLLGALVAVGVSIVVLPVATGVMIRRATIRQLATVRSFVEAAGGAGRDFAVPTGTGSGPSVEIGEHDPGAPDAGLASASLRDASETANRMRSASRAVDLATYQLESVLKPLVRFPTGGGYRKDDETRTVLVGVASTIRGIAYRGERQLALSIPQERALHEITSVMARSISALSSAVAGSPEGVWRSSVPLIQQFDERLTEGEVLLGYRLHALSRVDDALAGLSTFHGLPVDDSGPAGALLDRRPALSAGHVRKRFPVS